MQSRFLRIPLFFPLPCASALPFAGFVAVEGDGSSLSPGLRTERLRTGYVVMDLAPVLSVFQLRVFHLLAEGLVVKEEENKVIFPIPILLNKLPVQLIYHGKD